MIIIETVHTEENWLTLGMDIVSVLDLLVMKLTSLYNNNMYLKSSIQTSSIDYI